MQLAAGVAWTHNNADVRTDSKLFSSGGCRGELRARSGSEHGECVGRKRRVFVFVFVEQATCRSVGTLTGYIAKERNKFKSQCQVK